MLAPVDCKRVATAAQIVGRESELEHLEAALDALADGEPGLHGASRASPASARRACWRSCARGREERGHVVLSGAAAEFEREMPFSVWVDALDAYVASQDSRARGWDEELAASSARCCPR